MLRHLRVTNFAILSDVGLEFSAGFNALTGETGAGKSLIVEAVNLLRGGRASADIPRTGAEQAVVEAVFEVQPSASIRPRINAILAEAGLPIDDGELLVRRVIQRGGRSRTYVNGALTTAKRLAEIAEYLLDLCGQHQHQGLSDPNVHRQILDEFAEHPALLHNMSDAANQLRERQKELAELTGSNDNLRDRADYLRFQCEELDRAQVERGEEVALEQERQRLQSVGRLQHATQLAEELVYSGDNAAVDLLAAAARELEKLLRVDEQLTEPLRQIEEARVLAEDAIASLRCYGEKLEADPQRLEQVDERLALLSRLMRKHGGTIEQVVESHERLREELDTLEHRDQRRDELDAQVQQADQAARSAAAALNRSRKHAARNLAKEVETLLHDLGMSGAKLAVAVEATSVGVTGADRVEFLLTPNAGEAAKPLAKIASGGELSRIMLALKLALRKADEVATHVFDEVDAGIGGATAEVVGKQIRAVAEHHQVLCVTHLPQICAFAQTHFHVSKTVTGGRTETSVVSLNPTQRRDEIARMLGGATLTTSARAHAAEMLNAAN